MNELQTLKKQMAACAARYKAAVRDYEKYNPAAGFAEEEVGYLEEELDDLRRLDVSTDAGKKIVAKAVEQFRAAIQAEKANAKQFALKARQAEAESDDQYGLAERIYSRIQEYDGRYRFPAAFDETI